MKTPREYYGIALSQLLTERGSGSVSAVAEQAGIAQSYLSKLKKSRTRGKHETLESIARAMNTSYEAMVALGKRLDGARAPQGSARRWVEIPVFRCGTGSPSAFTDGGFAVGRSDASIEVREDWINENTFAVEIQGRSMEPTLDRGDIAIVVPGLELESGRLCFAAWPDDDGERVIKRFFRYGNQVVLKSDNPAREFCDIEVDVEDVRVYRVTKVIKVNP